MKPVLYNHSHLIYAYELIESTIYLPTVHFLFRLAFVWSRSTSYRVNPIELRFCVAGNWTLLLFLCKRETSEITIGLFHSFAFYCCIYNHDVFHILYHTYTFPTFIFHQLCLTTAYIICGMRASLMSSTGLKSRRDWRNLKEKPNPRPQAQHQSYWTIDQQRSHVVFIFHQNMQAH